MKKLNIFLLLIIFVFQVSSAQVPNTISYQGVLRNADGTLVSDGTYSLTFNLYESETEGTEIWSEKQSVVTTNGLFSVILGSETSFPDDVSFDKQYWLGITVGGGSELTPRSELTSVPYSLNTKSIPDGIVTESKIISGAVTPVKINTSDAVSGQALMFDGTSLGWSTPPGTGLTLPFSGTASSSSDAFSITNSGSGKVIYGVNTGTGYGGYFAINNASNYEPALYAETNGSGNAISGYTDGTGRAGSFVINNSSNSNDALYAYTNGSGNAIHGYTSGTGRAGYFEGIVTATNIIESTSGGFKFPDGSIQTTASTGGGGLTLPFTGTTSSSSPLFSITNTGTGNAGGFVINNPSNWNHALTAETNGTGRAGYFKINNTSNHNDALRVVTYGKGHAGVFSINNQSNSQPALHVSTNGTGNAGIFYGNVHVQGKLSKSSGSFVIDHPLDPENKVLSHSFVESPEMVNIYKGRSKLKDGAAVIELPDYFDALNHPKGREINLTPVNGWSPLYLEGEIINNQFTVKTTKDGNPEQEFSWIIYAVRNDEYAKKHPIVVEEEKGVNNNFTKGEYLNPDVFGQ